MKRILATAVVACALLSSCGGSSVASAPATTRATRTSSSEPATSTSTTAAPTTTTTTMPVAQIVKQTDAEVDRACTEAVTTNSEPVIQYEEAWGSKLAESDLMVRARKCVADRWAALDAAEAQRKADEAKKQADEDRAAEQAIQARVISMDEFSRIQTGMSYDKVVGIIGSPGELLSSSEFSGTVTAMYMWKGDPSGYGNATVMFQNDAVVSKSQFGL